MELTLHRHLLCEPASRQAQSVVEAHASLGLVPSPLKAQASHLQPINPQRALLGRTDPGMLGLNNLLRDLKKPIMIHCVRREPLSLKDKPLLVKSLVSLRV